MAFAATQVMEVVIKRSGGLVWKNWPMNHTRRQNAKKRHERLQQVEAVLKACSEEAPPNYVQTKAEDINTVKSNYHSRLMARIKMKTEASK